jgi:hypothetical protein
MVRVAACVATVFSIFTLLGCLIFVPVLWNKVSSIQEMVQVDLDEFNVSLRSPSTVCTVRYIVVHSTCNIVHYGAV